MSRETNFTAEDEKRIRQDMEKKYEDRMGLIIHASIFVLVNVAMWLVQLYSGAGFPFALIITLGWGSGMIGHLLYYYYKYGKGAEHREAAIEREIERYRERSAAYEKPKNDRKSQLGLTDDDALEDAYDDEASQAGSRKRG